MRSYGKSRENNMGSDKVMERPIMGYGVLLGLQKAEISHLIDRAAAGFPFRVLESLSASSGITLAETAQLAQIAPRTLARRKQEGKLTPAESDRVLRTARVLSQTIELFEGDSKAARRWLSEPQRAFNGKTPFLLATTDSGAREVEFLIARLEDGIFV